MVDGTWSNTGSVNETDYAAKKLFKEPGAHKTFRICETCGEGTTDGPRVH